MLTVHCYHYCDENFDIFCSGQRGHDVLDSVAILHTDSMKWVTPVIRGASAPAPRIRHAAACCRDKVFIFGGQVNSMP